MYSRRKGELIFLSVFQLVTFVENSPALPMFSSVWDKQFKCHISSMFNHHLFLPQKSDNCDEQLT